MASFIGFGPVALLGSAFEFIPKIFIKEFSSEINHFITNGNHDETLLYFNKLYCPVLGEICEGISGVCVDIVEPLVGETHPSNFNKSRMQVMASHEPGGTSI